MLKFKEYGKDKTYYFDCGCHSSEHTIRFNYLASYGEGAGCEPEIYTEVQLCKTKNVFMRIWAAIKYIYGYECRYGHWDCWLMKPEDISQLKKMIDIFEKDRRAFKKRAKRKAVKEN